MPQTLQLVHLLGRGEFHVQGGNRKLVKHMPVLQRRPGRRLRLSVMFVPRVVLVDRCAFHSVFPPDEPSLLRRRFAGTFLSDSAR